MMIPKVKKASVLIIDDDETVCKVLSGLVRHMGHKAQYAMTLKDGISALTCGVFDVVFLDVGMPDGNGVEALPAIKGAGSSPEVIIITGGGKSEGPLLALESGAWDYIEKPFSLQDLKLSLFRALQYHDEKKRGNSAVVIKRDGIVGTSPRIRHCIEKLGQAAASEANVLIAGETGTGKELFARAIHQNSRRSGNSFVVVDCTSLPGSLVESLLFGHEKGAFTGADRARDGMIKHSDGGTLFLDEVGELPLSIQKSFLRVLQEHRIRPLGAKLDVESRFRLISATHRDLDHMVEQELFREDLLYRLRSFTIDLPPLRERAEDILDLVIYHLRRLTERYGMQLKGFSPEFLETLAGYDWPGNARELVNTLDGVLAVARDDPILYPIHLPARIRAHCGLKNGKGHAPVADHPAEPEINGGNGGSLPRLRDFRAKAVSAAESAYLQKLMRISGNGIRHACQVSGLARSRLFDLLRKHNISRCI